MSRLLRQSSRLARVARISHPAVARRGYQISLLQRCPQSSLFIPSTNSRLRPYSTNSPQPPRDDKPQNSKPENEDEKKSATEAKRQEQDAEAKSQDDGTVKSSESQEQNSTQSTPLPEGWVWLTKDELKHLAGLVESMPNFQKQFMRDLLGQFGKFGAPKELRDLLNDVKARGPSIKDTAKILNVGHITAKRFAQMEMEREAKEQNKNQDQENRPRSQRTQESREDGQRPGGSGKPGLFGLGMSDLIVLTIVIFFLSPFLEKIFFGEQKEITWQELRRAFLDKGLVERFVVLPGSNQVQVLLNQDAVQTVYQGQQAFDPRVKYYFSIGSVDSFEKRLDAAQDELGIPSSERIPVKYGQASAWTSLIFAFGPTILLVGLLYWTTRQMGSRGGNQMFSFGRSRAKQFNHETGIKVKFADVAGMDEAKVEIMEFVSFLKHPEKFERLGAKIPRGAILSGPPGTGKTLLAKATAGESGVPFFSVSGSEFVEMFVGVGPSRVRDLFATARKNSPCIIFIDEIDAIGRARQDSSRMGGANDERESTLNQILTEMDGFNTSEQVVVLAGTNRADVLDKALMRPGRFDRHIYIDRPTMKGREAIFKVHLQKIVTKEDIEYLCGRLATLTPGFSGADIANVVNEAALIGARANAESVELIHFEQAIERVVGGLERKSLVLKPLEKRTVAYHEAGHAICGWYFEHADPLLKVSIIPRGQGALGYAQYLPQDAYLMSVHQLMDRMAMTLGGRISEELHFPTVTTGASDDFKKVTAMARQMVTQWGMSEKVGPVHYENDPNQLQKPFAESTAQDIDAEVHRIVEEAYKKCKELLTAKKVEIGLVAEELLKKEMLTRDDMVRLLGPRPFPDNHQEFEKYFGSQVGGSVAGPPPPPPTATGETDTPSPAPAFKDLDKQ